MTQNIRMKCNAMQDILFIKQMMKQATSIADACAEKKKALRLEM